MTQPAPPEDDTGFVRPFVDVLRELNRGTTHGEATDVLHNLISGIQETGKKGSMTITLTIEPATKTDSEVLLIAASVTAKVPRIEARKSPFYVTADGNLSASDPKQLSFESLKVIETPAPRPIKTAQ